MDAENVLIELQSCVPMDCGSAVSSNASFFVPFAPFNFIHLLLCLVGEKSHSKAFTTPRVEQSSAGIKVNREK